jgi:hypothetical protein
VLVLMLVLIIVVTLAHFVVVIMVAGLSAMGVVVEIVVYLDVEIAQLLVVKHDVVEGDDVARVVLLTIDGIGGDAVSANDRRCHVFVVVTAASIETQCKYGYESHQKAHVDDLFHCCLNLNLQFIIYHLAKR